MSSGSSLSPLYAPRLAEGLQMSAEDCRDYLRTGRCKYGPSCKYNHPANVQSGGGMRAPIDPSEPLFPVRLNEPLCQYYMKHGSCKFGQACKFNHPPQLSHSSQVAGDTPVTGNGRSTDVPVVFSQCDGPMMLQFLPQRPDEPDCIYFLKNGRCKYGATCRYHHPVNYHKHRAEESRRQHRAQLQEQYASQKAQYIAQTVPNGNFKGQHVMSDNPLTFMSYDVPSGTPGFQPMSLVMGADGSTSYATHIGPNIVTEQGSSASSIASSYETAPTGFDQFQGDPSMWARARRNGSGNSLAAYTIDSSNRGARLAMTHSPSEGSMASRRHRASSHGSASESSYHDVNQSGLRRSDSVGSWRNDRVPSSTYDRRLPTQYISRIDGVVSDQQPRGRPPSMSMAPGHRPSPRSRKPRAHGENDEGFTMMTSALLNMLDTPEEASTESFSDEDNNRYRLQEPCEEQHPLYGDPLDVESSMFERLSLNGVKHNYQIRSVSDTNTSDSWSPTWQGSKRGPASPPASSLDGNAQALSAIPPRHSQGHNTPPSSDIGLFIP